MMKKYFVFFISIATLSLSQAQAPEIEWLKTYGGSNADSGLSIKTTTDGGYIVTGTTFSDDGDVSVQYGNGDFWVVKLNSIGDIEWEKSIGTIDNDYSLSIEQTSDGGYIVVGLTGTPITGSNSLFYVVKLFSNGNIQWQNTFGGSNFDFARRVKETNDGGFIIAGTVFSNDGDVSVQYGNGDFWIIKISNIGDLIWEKSYGGSAFDELSDIQLTNDGGYIIVGTTASVDGDVTNNNGSFDVWVIKVSSEGALLWEKTYGGSGVDNAQSVKQNIDGTFIVVAHTNSNDGDVSEPIGASDFWVIKLNENGNLIWEKTYGGTQTDAARYVQLTNDGNIVVVGFTKSNDVDVTNNQGDKDVWIIKIDQNGELIWEKTIGGSDEDEGWNVQETNDGGLVISGITFSSDGDITINQGENDILVIKLAPDNLSNQTFDNQLNYDLYPNPVENFLHIDVNNYNALQEIEIIDILGKTYYSEKLEGNKTTIDVRNLSKGVYLVKLKGKNEIQTIKFLKK